MAVQVSRTLSAKNHRNSEFPGVLDPSPLPSAAASTPVGGRLVERSPFVRLPCLKRKRPSMPTPKSPLALALSLACAAQSFNAIAAESQQLTYTSAPSTVVCAVQHVCDVELQPGEVITDLDYGDRGRWSITPAITNIDNAEIHHLVIRPYDVNLETSVVVLTNRRTYHLQLKSDASRYMPRVTFTYPEEAERKRELSIAKELTTRQRGLLPQTNEYLGDLDFKYKIEGQTQLKPLRVYNDHLKTTIELPPIAAGNIPTLVVTEAGKNYGKAVSYTTSGDRLIADAVFDAAELVYGSGTAKGRVSIERTQKTGRGPAGAIVVAPILPPSKTPPVAAVATAAASPAPITTAPALIAAAPKTTAEKPVERRGQVTPGADRSAPGVTAPKPFTPPSSTPAVTVTAPAPAVDVKAPSPALKPASAPVMVWEARVGESLRTVILNWSQRAHYTVSWTAEDLDYPIDAPLRFEGSYENAVAAIFRLYEKAERSFIVDGRRAQMRLNVSEDRNKTNKRASL